MTVAPAELNPELSMQKLVAGNFVDVSNDSRISGEQPPAFHQQPGADGCDGLHLGRYERVPQRPAALQP